MPYIEQSERPRFNDRVDDLAETILTPGEFNYVITRLVRDVLNNGAGKYADFNAAIGVLECVKQELYRTQVAPYEDVKAVINGDIYEELLA